MRMLLSLPTVAAAVLVALASPSCGEKAPCDEPYSCPDAGTIDCMPPGGPGEPLCAGECHDWIVANCPDVGFVF